MAKENEELLKNEAKAGTSIVKEEGDRNFIKKIVDKLKAFFLGSNNLEVEKKLEEFQKQINNLRDSHSNLIQDHKKLEGKITSLTEEVEALKTENKKLKDENARLENVIKEQKNKIEELEKENKKPKEGDMEALKQERDSLIKENQELKIVAMQWMALCKNLKPEKLNEGLNSFKNKEQQSKKPTFFQKTSNDSVPGTGISLTK